MASKAYHLVDTYRVGDPIENLQLRVTLRKRASMGERRCGAGDSSSVPSEPSKGAKKGARKERGTGRFRRKSGEGPDAAPSDDADSADDDAGLAAQMRPLRLGQDEEAEHIVCPPRTFRWQEKAFGPTEVRNIHRAEEKKGAGGGLVGRLLGSGRDAGNLSNHLRDNLRALEDQSVEEGLGAYAGEIIYTRVHSEAYSEFSEWASKYTDSASEAPSKLARQVLAGTFLRQHRDMLGEADCATMHVLAELPASDFGEGADSRPLVDASKPGSPRKSLRERSSRGSSREPDADATVELTLCTLKVYPGGRFDMRPGFSLGTGGPTLAGDEPPLARWFQLAGSRYEYMLENVSEFAEGAAAEAEALADRLAKARADAHNTAHHGPRYGSLMSRSLADIDFDSPMRKACRVHHFIELQSATHFDASSLYLAYYALASPGWRLLPDCVASAVTQTSAVVGEEQRAVLGFPIELSVESDGPPAHARPPLSLFLSVMHFDSWGRHKHLGYAHVAPPAEAGASVVEVGAWRLAEGRADAMRTFFVGGTEELADLRSLSVPEDFDGSVLNKHGLQTVSSGQLTLKTQTVLLQHAVPAKPGAAAAKAKAAAKAAGLDGPAARAPADLGPLKGAVGVNRLGRSETAADRVKKRLEERRRGER